jgi:hypothetical protein
MEMNRNVIIMIAGAFIVGRSALWIRHTRGKRVKKTGCKTDD